MGRRNKQPLLHLHLVPVPAPPLSMTRSLQTVRHPPERTETGTLLALALALGLRKATARRGAPALSGSNEESLFESGACSSLDLRGGCGCDARRSTRLSEGQPKGGGTHGVGGFLGFEAGFPIDRATQGTVPLSNDIQIVLCRAKSELVNEDEREVKKRYGKG